MAQILLIEDDVDSRDLVVVALSLDAHEVDVAATADEGLALARSRRPQLILLDMMLPGPHDGFDFIRELRVDPKLAAIPILAITAQAMRGDRERIFAAGADAYVPKPIVDLFGFRSLVGRMAAL